MNPRMTTEWRILWRSERGSGIAEFHGEQAARDLCESLKEGGAEARLQCRKVSDWVEPLEDLDIPPGRFDLTEEDIENLPVLDLDRALESS
jgi:hypothetical protein